MPSKMIKNLAVLCCIFISFSSCSNNGDIKIGSLRLETSSSSKAAGDMCDCLRPISEVIDKGKSQKNKDFADYLEIIGNGIGETGHLLECIEQFQEKYESNKEDENWEKEMEKNIRERCPKVFERFEKLGIDINSEK